MTDDILINEGGNKPNVKELWKQGIVEGLDPELGNDYVTYQDDPVGFAEDVLSVKLTSAQKELLEAVRDYEIVQVKSATGVGKTFVLSVLATWVYKCWKWAQVYTTAAPPESNLKKLLWGEIYSLTQEHPLVFEMDKIRASMHIDRHPKQFVTGVSIPKDAKPEDIVTKWSGKHSPVLVFIFDEGDGIPDAVYEGADGCMSGGVFVRQIVCYNPKKKSGEAYRRENERRAHIIKMSALDHPNVRTGRDIVPGAVVRDKTILRIDEWTEPKPLDKELDETCWQVPAFLVGLTAERGNGTRTEPLNPGWRVIVDDQFYYKVLGEYPAGGMNQLIWDNWIDDAVSKWEAMRALNGGTIKPPEGVEQPVMGQDVADMGDDSHCTAFRYGIWWDVPITWKGVDPDDAAERAAKLYIERNAKVCMVDSIGVGAGVPTRMYKSGKELGKRITAIRVNVGEKALGHTDEGKFYRMRDESYWAMRTAFRNGQVAMPPPSHNNACQRLHDSLKAMTYEIQGDSIRVAIKEVMKKRIGYSPDEMEAYMLTYSPLNNWMGGI
jgi:hypothetical protein